MSGGSVIQMTRQLGQLAARLMMARYLIVSIFALWLDAMVLLTLSRWLLPASYAALLGYTIGMVVHWQLSVRFVFHNGGTSSTHARRVGFVVSALIGLAITVGVVSWLGSLGVPLALAKGCAVIASFVTVYLVRKYVVFARR